MNHQGCLQGTLNHSELMKSKVRGKRYGRPGQKGRLGNRGHYRRSPPEKTPPDPHLGSIFWLSDGRLRKARAQRTRGKRRASEAIREVESSGLTTWTTHKCPPWTGRTTDREAKSSDLEELGISCGVQGIRASSAHNWQWWLLLLQTTPAKAHGSLFVGCGHF